MIDFRGTTDDLPEDIFDHGLSCISWFPSVIAIYGISAALMGSRH